MLLLSLCALTIWSASFLTVGEVLRREAFSGAAGILLEGHVQMPVKLVLYTPVPSC